MLSEISWRAESAATIRGPGGGENFQRRFLHRSQHGCKNFRYGDSPPGRKEVHVAENSEHDKASITTQTSDEHSHLAQLARVESRIAHKFRKASWLWLQLHEVGM